MGSSLPRAAELRDHGAALELNTAWQPRFAAEPCSTPADDPPVGGLLHDIQRCLLVQLSFLRFVAGTLWFVRGFAGGLWHRRRPTLLSRAPRRQQQSDPSCESSSSSSAASGGSASTAAAVVADAKPPASPAGDPAWQPIVCTVAHL